MKISRDLYQTMQKQTAPKSKSWKNIPLTGFGNLLAEGVKEAVDEKGILGIFMGGLTASSGGITAAMVFGVVAAAIFPSKQKDS
ncbi:MAG: SpoVA/SpoVAEb family sporulation membrane protein [Ruminococcus sp.]|nr:SpoVA/SpoVAEb family sporulation membrane protein [Ruminococcus sp.]